MELVVDEMRPPSRVDEIDELPEPVAGYEHFTYEVMLRLWEAYARAHRFSEGA